MHSSAGQTRRPRRRLLTVATVLAAGALTLTACGQADNVSGGSSDETASAAPAEFDPNTDYTLRYSWWGSDVRHQLNQEVIDAFEAEYPNVTITPDFTDWAGYWDKLATGIAGGDTPDVFMQEERYLRDYGQRGVIADLNQYDIATDKIDPDILSVGEFDGGQYGIPTGINVYSLVANPAVFAKAGVEMPDDKTWTWDDFEDIANEIGSSGQGVFGMQDGGYNEPGFMVYARQHGEELYTADGKLGYKDQTLVDWWKIALNLQKNGGQPSASETVELQSGGPEQSLLGTNRGAMGPWWTNQLTAIESAAGTDMQLLRWPGESEGKRTGMYFKPSMYISMSADTESPAAAAKFIDFMVNSEEAGKLLLSDRGLPANTDVREAVQAQFTPSDVRAADFMKDLEDEIVDGVPTPPVGAGEVGAILGRINSEVLFERMTPEEGAKQFRTEVEQAIS
jgi:multiple sugar transport system substrate-binding protein